MVAINLAEMKARIATLGITARAPVKVADLSSLIAAVEAAQAFCKTPPDWTDPAAQRAYGTLRDKLARFAEAKP